MKTYLSPLFLLLISSLIVIRIVPIQANPALDITVKTDKQKYNAGDLVQVYGNLTLDGVSVTDGLVGIQIQTSQDKLLIIRTLSTGTPRPEMEYIFIEYVVPCDPYGNPIFSFEKGVLAYFKISVTNQDIEPHEALMIILTYYNDSTPFGFAAIHTEISAGSNPTFIISIPIPGDAVLGTTTAYANAYTNWPKLAGTPYCREANATFEITDGTLGAASQTTQNPLTTLQNSETEDYNTTFRLVKNAPPGNYMAYVTSRYLGESAANSTTFEVYILGDIDLDGDIDGFDLGLFVQAYNYEYDPLADLDFDGDVDGFDLSIFVQNYNLY